jgi:hypothetical protein
MRSAARQSVRVYALRPEGVATERGTKRTERRASQAAVSVVMAVIPEAQLASIGRH